MAKPERRRGCPHNETRLCPLYWAMHDGGGGSCDDGRLDEGTCGVDRGGLSYDNLFAAMTPERWQSRTGILTRATASPGAKLDLEILRFNSAIN